MVNVEDGGDILYWYVVWNVEVDEVGGHCSSALLHYDVK